MLGWDFVHAQDDLNLHILLMFEDIFLLDIAHPVWYSELDIVYG